MNTANCYIINAPGKYSLPLVYGNAIKNGATNTSAYTSSASGTGVLANFVNHLDAAITDPYIYNNAKCTPKDALLLWQDAENLVTNVALAGDGHSLTFEVGSSTIKEGNAVVAVRDAKDDIMWSWHIWVTDYVPGLDATVEAVYDPTIQARDKRITSKEGKTSIAMGSLLGWCNDRAIEGERSVRILFYPTSNGQKQPLEDVLWKEYEFGDATPWSIPEEDDLESYGVVHPCVITIRQKILINEGNSTLYQWGRKDPVLGGIRDASGATVDKSCYSDSGYAFDGSRLGAVSLGTVIRTPHIFRNFKSGSNGDWCSTTYDNLWSADNTERTSENATPTIKTIYDPSPVGYCLPMLKVFSGGKDVTGSAPSIGQSYGSLCNSPYTCLEDFENNFGRTMYCNPIRGIGNFDTAGGVFFLPAADYRYSSNGNAYEMGVVGGCWYAVSGGKVTGKCFSATRWGWSDSTEFQRVGAMSVCPVREE